MAQAIVSIFKYQEGVEGAINELKDLNYNPAEFSVLMKDIKKGETLDDKTGATIAGGAISGAVTGGVLAGVAGLLVGLGVISFPGVGALLVAGPIASALGLTGATAAATTAAVTGVVGGGIIGALAGAGFSREDAVRYEEYIRAGGILLIIPTRDKRITEVRDIVSKHGATDVRQLELHSQTADYQLN